MGSRAGMDSSFGSNEWEQLLIGPVVGATGASGR